MHTNLLIDKRCCACWHVVIVMIIRVIKVNMRYYDYFGLLNACQSKLTGSSNYAVRFLVTAVCNGRVRQPCTASWATSEPATGQCERFAPRYSTPQAHPSWQPHLPPDILNILPLDSNSVCFATYLVPNPVITCHIAVHVLPLLASIIPLWSLLLPLIHAVSSFVLLLKINVLVRFAFCLPPYNYLFSCSSLSIITLFCFIITGLFHRISLSFSIITGLFHHIALFSQNSADFVHSPFCS